MATIEKIIKILPHPNADKLELAQILGYQAVVAKDTFHDDDKVIFIQPDNVLPLDMEWSHEYLKYAPKRIKAIKLRKEWSEGLICDLSIYTNLIESSDNGEDSELNLEEGTDISEVLGITHYEPPLPKNLAEQGISALPYQIPKTDEKRCASIIKKVPYGETVDVSLKIDGQSWSAYYHLKDDKFGVLGRRLEFPLEIENNYTRHVATYDIENKLRQYCQKHNVSICLRGESYGEGIQRNKNNPHSSLDKGLMIFSIYLIDEHEYANKGHQHYFLNVCKELDLPHVPIVEQDVELTVELTTRYAKGIDKLDGKPFEGVVIKTSSGSFKVINKTYDSKK